MSLENSFDLRVVWNWVLSHLNTYFALTVGIFCLISLKNPSYHLLPFWVVFAFLFGCRCLILVKVVVEMKCLIDAVSNILVLLWNVLLKMVGYLAYCILECASLGFLLLILKLNLVGSLVVFWSFDVSFHILVDRDFVANFFLFNLRRVHFVPADRFVLRQHSRVALWLLDSLFYEFVLSHWLIVVVIVFLQRGFRRRGDSLYLWWWRDSSRRWIYRCWSWCWCRCWWRTLSRCWTWSWAVSGNLYGSERWCSSWCRRQASAHLIMVVWWMSYNCIFGFEACHTLFVWSWVFLLSLFSLLFNWLQHGFIHLLLLINSGREALSNSDETHVLDLSERSSLNPASEDIYYQ